MNNLPICRHKMLGNQTVKLRVEVPYMILNKIF